MTIRRHLWLERCEPDLVVEGLRLCRWLHVEFGAQCLAAVLVLREGSAALATAPERAHQLLVRLLTPWVQFALAPRHPPDVVERAPALVILSQARQDAETLLMQRFTLQRDPLLEHRAGSKEELIE